MPPAPERAFHLVAGSKPWNRGVFDEVIRHYPGEWAFAGSRDELADAVRVLCPVRVYFLHWSWKVPDSLLAAAECINFHMTDLPCGRGGSPLQNLIARGHVQT